MGAMDGSKRLISATHTGGMEDDYRENTMVQLLRHEHRHLQRLSQFLAVVQIFLICAVLVTAVVFGARSHSPDCKPTMQAYSHPPGDMEKHQQHTDFPIPSAMLTAPTGSITIGHYLDWESNDGNAHCQGGIDYSSGHLRVPIQGLYRVFLQITFEGGAGPCGSVRELKLTNIVYLFKKNYPKAVAVLSSVDTVSCNQVSWSKSLYTSGLFELEANSSLAVTSSYPELITKRQELVFFGVELVSQ